MDKQTLTTYGMILVSVLIVAALLVVFTPLGEQITTGIDGIVDEFINRAQVDEDPSDVRDTVNRTPPSDMERTITLTVIYENGQEVIPTKEIVVGYGETVDLTNEVPSINGYKANFNPGKQTVTRDLNYTIILYPEQFNITYHLNGGTVVSSKPNTYIYGQVTQLPTKVIKEGYTFTGWYDNASLLGTPVKEISSGTKEDINLYAGWSNATFTVTYMSQGVDITNKVTGVKNVTYGLSQDLPRLNTTNGLYFAGWYNNEMFNGAPSTYTPQYPDDNLVFYAKWTNDGYNVTYVTNGGSFSSAYPSNYTNGSGLTLPMNISRNGCTFDGWYDNATYTGEKITQIEPTSTGDKVFYAKWTPNTYIIDYITNGGSINGSFNTMYTYFDTKNTPTIAGESVKYPTSVYKSGYVFVGWRDTATGEIVTQTEDGRSGHIRLEAEYTTATYALTYDANGGSFISTTSNIPTQTTNINYGSTYGSLPQVFRSGCTFIGWFTEPVGGQEVTSGTIYAPTGPITIYAHWAKNSYDIVYEKNGGDFESTPKTTFEFGTSYRLPEDIYKEHHTFVGWYTSPDFIPGTEIDEITTNISTNVSVYAKWSPVLYTITYDTAGGDLSGMFATTYTYGESIALPKPTKWGCSFNGWKDNDTGEIVMTISTTTYGNKHYVAQWGSVGTQVTVNLIDPKGNIYIKDAQPLTYILEDIVIGREYTINANSIAQLLSVGEEYYHGSYTFSITNETGFVDGKYQINLHAYPYRRVIMNSMILDTNTNLTIYENVIGKFKQEQDMVVDVDKNNSTLYEALNVGHIKIFDDELVRKYAFANKVSINGQMFDCTSDAAEINKLIIDNYDFGAKDMQVIFWYAENVYSIIFNDHLDQSMVPVINKPTNFPTTYLSTEGYQLPDPIRNCHIFAGWVVLREDGTAVELINGNTIPAGTTGDLTLTSKWIQRDVDDATHIYQTVITETCDKEGLKRCTKCEIEAVIPSTGHNFEGVNPQSYTGTENGFINDVYTTYVSGEEYHRYLCKNCSAAYKLEKHKWENGGEFISHSLAEHKKQCETCRAAYYYEHSFTGTYLDPMWHNAVCKNCDHEHKELHELYPDDVKRWMDNQFHLTGCTVCNREWDEGHRWAETEGGFYCEVCDKNKEHIVTEIP